MRSSLITAILSFICFLFAKFGIAFIADMNCEPWTTCYYVFVSLSFFFAFLALSFTFKGWKRYLMDGVAGFFIGEAINQYYYDGTYSGTDIAFYLITPVLFYFGGKTINDVKRS